MWTPRLKLKVFRFKILLTFFNTPTWMPFLWIRQMPPIPHANILSKLHISVLRRRIPLDCMISITLRYQSFIGLYLIELILTIFFTVFALIFPARILRPTRQLRIPKNIKVSWFCLNLACKIIIKFIFKL